jgi:hypothetical protein
MISSARQTSTDEKGETISHQPGILLGLAIQQLHGFLIDPLTVMVHDQVIIIYMSASTSTMNHTGEYFLANSILQVVIFRFRVISGFCRSMRKYEIGQAGFLQPAQW